MARHWDFARFRQSDSVGAIFLCDIAHFAGLVPAARILRPSACPCGDDDHHKTLRGRAAA